MSYTIRREFARTENLDSPVNKTVTKSSAAQLIYSPIVAISPVAARLSLEAGGHVNDFPLKSLKGIIIHIKIMTNQQKLNVLGIYSPEDLERNDGTRGIKQLTTHNF